MELELIVYLKNMVGQYQVVEQNIQLEKEQLQNQIEQLDIRLAENNEKLDEYTVLYELALRDYKKYGDFNPAG